MVMNVYRAMDRSRVQFDFLVFGNAVGAYEDEAADLGARIFRIPTSRRGGTWRLIPKIASVIAREGPFAAVHSHVNFASAPVLLGAALAKEPNRIAHAHSAGHSPGGLGRYLYRLASRAALNRVAVKAVGCGETAGRYLFGRRWLRDGQWLPNSVGEEWLRRLSVDESLMIRRNLGVEAHQRLIVSVGRLVPQKNHDFLLRASRTVVQRDPDAVFVLVGDGPLAARLANDVRDSELRGRVKLLGPRRDVVDILAAADLMVMPSLYEGFPVALVEAQAAGLPCLVSDRITQEVDLGIGLVRFLPIADPRVWAKAICEPLPARVPLTIAREALSERGFLASTAANALASIYGLTS